MRNSPIDMTDLSLVEAYKDWLANEAEPAFVYMHRQSANSLACWRVIAQKRHAARLAANRPW
jgi:hypothetical protein